MDPILAGNALLRSRLAALAGRQSDQDAPIDVVVTANEINGLHGTGPLIQRVLKGRENIYAIRSRDDWDEQDFGAWSARIFHEGSNRPECFERILQTLGGRRIASVLCVPFLANELRTSIAVEAAFGARLCAYIMDDQNIAVNTIPDDLMREFLERCSLRLVTHPELRAAYQRKYALPFWILPAVVPADLVLGEDATRPWDRYARRGALLGSFWDQSWFDRLCETLAGSGWRIDWYGNNQSPWLRFPAARLKAAGIQALGLISEERLAVELRKYPFVLVPSGSLDAQDHNQAVASLSLPGRIIFAAATAHTPILMVGSPDTCGARFVQHFRIGETVPYNASALHGAMDRLAEAAMQRALRGNAAAMAPLFSGRGVVEWLAESIRLGSPADPRFEDAFWGYDIGSSWGSGRA